MVSSRDVVKPVQRSCYQHPCDLWVSQGEDHGLSTPERMMYYYHVTISCPTTITAHPFWKALARLHCQQSNCSQDHAISPYWLSQQIRMTFPNHQNWALFSHGVLPFYWLQNDLPLQMHVVCL